MKIYKAPVVLWKDAHGNWYGRHLEPFFFLPSDICIMMDLKKRTLLEGLKTSLKRALDAHQKYDEVLDPVGERQYEWTTVSFSVRASQA
nr:hypothetical protein [Thermoguttaceae bacterium]